MAVARPQPRPTASRGLQIWLIVAFAVTVIFAALFFILLADQSKIKEARKTAEDNLAKVISQREQTSAGRFFDRADRGKTMVGLMTEEMQGLAQLATGASTPEESGITAVRQKVETLFRAIRQTEGIGDPTGFQPGGNLHDALRTLHTLYVKALQANAELTQTVAQLTTDKAELSKNLAKTAETFEAGSKEMQDSLTKVESERDEFRGAKNQEIDGFKRGIAQIGDEKDAGERKLKNRITEIEQAVQSRDKAIGTLQEKLDELVGPAVDPEAIATEADGQIIQAVPSDAIVYVNLGKKNRLTLGMTFAVFPTPVPGQPREKAKGTIEVVGIHTNTAECRVVTASPGDPILEGDLIANVIYDPNRPTRFVIAGRFDLDYDGRDDIDGNDRITALVREWGGQIVENLDERVDFVVIGTKPPVLRLTEDATPEQQERHKEQKTRETKFLALKAEAKALSIPMLTQAQFFRFIGRPASPARSAQAF